MRRRVRLPGRSGRARLDNRSAPLPNSLVDIITRCDGLRIEVSGHTGSDGAAAANQRMEFAVVIGRAVQIPVANGVLAGLIAVAAMARANAEPRIALIVGNAVYGSVAALENPVNDARLMAETLTDKGFVVTLRANADQVTLNRAIAQFGRDLRTRPEMRQGCSILPGTGCKGLPSAITNH